MTKLSDLTIHRSLGCGGTGQVSYATDSSGNEYAFKALNCPSDMDRAVMLIREGRKLGEMNHCCIIRTHGFVKNQENEDVGLLLEYMPGGNILDAKSRFKRKTGNEFPEHLKVRTIYDIAQGLQYLHGNNDKKRHVHHDIKARNCLLDKDLHAKICDLETLKGEITTQVIEARGTFSHLAPEVFSNQATGLACEPELDIYSFGIFMFEVISEDSTPYPSLNNALFQMKVKGGLRPDTRALKNDELVALMKKCWDANSKERPTATEVCETLKKIYEPMKEKADKMAAEFGPLVFIDKPDIPPVVLDENLERVEKPDLRPVVLDESLDRDDNNPRHVSAEEAETVLNLEYNGIFLKDKTKAVDEDLANRVGSTIGPNDFRPVGRCLLFTKNEMDTIEHDKRFDGIQETNIAMLKKWREKYAENATHEWLATACLSMARPELLKPFPQYPRSVKVQ